MAAGRGEAGIEGGREGRAGWGRRVHAWPSPLLSSPSSERPAAAASKQTHMALPPPFRKRGRGEGAGPAGGRASARRAPLQPALMAAARLTFFPLRRSTVPLRTLGGGGGALFSGTRTSWGGVGKESGQRRRGRARRLRRRGASVCDGRGRCQVLWGGEKAPQRERERGSVGGEKKNAVKTLPRRPFPLFPSR